MSKNNENKLIPRLRFPEFQHSGEWEVKKLGEVLIKNKTKNKDNTINLVETVSNKFGFIKQDEYFENRIVASKDTSNYYVIKKGYFAYNPSRIDVGSLAYKFDNNESIISPLYVSFKAKNDLIDDIFLLNFFNSTRFTEQMIFEGGVRNTLSFENLAEIKIPFPSLPEQQKIASCLSSLDEVIAGERQKLALLQQHKKGLLQQLFPQEGETLPTLRFKEFEDSGEWEVKKLGEVCDVRDGTHDSPKYVSQGYPLITSKNLMSDGTIDFNNVNYLTEYDYNQINKRSKVDVGDILFGMIGTIGNPVVVKTEGFAIKNVALIKSQGGLNQEFLVYQLKSDFIEKQFKRMNAGGILKFIALGIIRNLDIIVTNKKEQQKIATCLSSLDDVINAQTQKIELLEQHKKGLLQGLFPNVNDHE